MTIECSCKLCPSPGMYAVTSIPLVKRTLATLRRAEFGFFGVVVYTRVHTPRFCGDCCSAGTFLRDFCTTRGLAISWLIVGMSAFTFSRSRETNRLREIPLGPLQIPQRAAFRENDPPKAKSRQPPIAEQKALRRHRGPRASSDRSDRSNGTEVVHPINSEGRAHEN